jgi:transcription antitermination factor NusG
MENRNDIQDIVKQLSELQLKQNVLLARLHKATTEEREADEKPPAFEIGQTVGIKNPGPFQASKGRITRIGSDRITVTTSSGAKIVRAPKNLIRN